MTKDELITLTSSKLLQYKIPVSIALITVMFVLRAYDAASETSNNTARENELVAEPVSSASSKQTAGADDSPPIKKKIPTWLPITEGMLPGRKMLALNSVEYIPIEGIPNHPERIYSNPNCIVKLSKTPFSVNQVMEYIDNEYIPGEECIRYKAENNAMLEKTIPDTASYQEVLPLDAVIIE